MDIDNTLLQQFLFWVVGGVGAGVVVYFLFENVQPLASLQPKHKRYASVALSAVVAMAAFAACVGLGYFDTPSGWQGWLEGLFAVAFVAVGGSQLLHGNRKLE